MTEKVGNYHRKHPPLKDQWAARNDGPQVRLAVCGSRTLKDERVKIMLLEEIENYGITCIVTAAEPEGVCGVARDLCKEKAIPLRLHFLNFRYLSGAFEHRTKAYFLDCDRVILIHDGVSKGTANGLKMAQKMDIPCRYEKLEPSPYESSVGFDIGPDEWDQDDLEFSAADLL